MQVATLARLATAKADETYELCMSLQQHNDDLELFQVRMARGSKILNAILIDRAHVVCHWPACIWSCMVLKRKNARRRGTFAHFGH